MKFRDFVEEYNDLAWQLVGICLAMFAPLVIVIATVALFWKLLT